MLSVFSLQLGLNKIESCWLVFAYTKSLPSSFHDAQGFIFKLESFPLESIRQVRLFNASSTNGLLLHPLECVYGAME